jgi:hypothetical protein
MFYDSAFNFFPSCHSNYAIVLNANNKKSILLTFELVLLIQKLHHLNFLYEEAVIERIIF